MKIMTKIQMMNMIMHSTIILNIEVDNVAQRNSFCGNINYKYGVLKDMIDDNQSIIEMLPIKN